MNFFNTTVDPRTSDSLTSHQVREDPQTTYTEDETLRRGVHMIGEPSRKLHYLSLSFCVYNFLQSLKTPTTRVHWQT